MRIFFLFIFLYSGLLHAQWINCSGLHTGIYLDPELIKKNHVNGVTNYSKVHSGNLKDDRMLEMREKYWFNKTGNVIGGGDIFGSDTIDYVDYIPIDPDSSIWIEVMDSVKKNGSEIYTYSRDSDDFRFVLYNINGQVLSYGFDYQYSKDKSTRTRNYCSYKNNRLDSVYHTGLRGSYSKYIYNSEGCLERIEGYEREGYSFDTVKYSIQSVSIFTYDKRGLIKSIKETFSFSKTYWYFESFKWSFYRKN